MFKKNSKFSTNQQSNIYIKIFQITNFIMFRNSSAFLVLDYEEVVFRSFNSGSIDIRRESVLSAVWQLDAIKDNLSKYCPSELVYIHLYFKK